MDPKGCYGMRANHRAACPKTNLRIRAALWGDCMTGSSSSPNSGKPMVAPTRATLAPVEVVAPIVGTSPPALDRISIRS
jgi:hypothetical protein